MKYLSYDGLKYLYGKILARLNTKVDKITGKGLSTNDYTTTEKTKLAGIATGANKTTVDTALSTTSTNPVQNKAVKAALDGKAASSHTHTKSQITDMPTKVSQFQNDKGFITQADIDTSQNHTHANKAVLDKITQSLLDSSANLKGSYQITDYTTLDPTTLGLSKQGDIIIVKSTSGATGQPTGSSMVGYIIVNNGLTYQMVLWRAGAALSEGTVMRKYYQGAWGSWDYILTSNHNPTATATTAGAMSAADKTKLDSVAVGANKTIVDAALSSTSANPVQNKAVKIALDGKADGSRTYAELEKLKNDTTLTATVSGTGSVEMSDAWTVPVSNLQVYGKSEQVVTTGAQLINYDDRNITGNGITYTLDNKSGTITCNGTATALSVCTFQIPEIPVGTVLYVSANNPAAHTSNNIFLRTGTSSSVIDDASSTPLTTINAVRRFTTTVVNKVFQVRIGAGTTVTNFVVKPMLSKGATAIPWEPYSGGIPGPSPDYPQDMKSVCDPVIVSSTAQMLDIEAYIKNSSNNSGVGKAVSINNGLQITSSGTHADIVVGSVSKYNQDLKLFVSSGLSCTLSWGALSLSNPDNALSVRFYVGYFTANNDSIGYDSFVASNTNTYTFKPPKNSAYAVLRFGWLQRTATANETMTVPNIMLNIGLTAHPWQPYKGISKVDLTGYTLHGVGNVRDLIERRDGVWGIYRYLANRVISSAPNAAAEQGWKNDAFVVHGMIPDAKPYIGFGSVAVCASNRFMIDKPSYIAGTVGSNKLGIGSDTGRSIYIGLQGIVPRTDVTALRNWLASNPIDLIYELETPTWEPFPAGIQAQLNALLTYSGDHSTVYTLSDIRPDIEVEYFRNVPIVDSLMPEIDYLKKSVSDGKRQLAAAITLKQVATAATDTFAKMAENISKIVLGSGNAQPSDVLAPKTFSNESGGTLTGTIPSREASTITPGKVVQKLAAKQYLSGEQTIESLGGNATANQVLAGRLFSSDSVGRAVAGTMPDNSTTTSNGVVPGISASYPNIPTREGSALQRQVDTKGAVRISLSPPQGYYPGGSYINRPGDDFGNATFSQVLSGVRFTSSATVNGLGNMPNRGAVNQTLGINGSYTIPAGYHNGSGKVTQKLTTKAAATYTPGTANQVIAANQYLSGAQTIKGDGNLVAANIVKGKTIFNIAGNRNYIDKIGKTYNYNGYELSGVVGREQVLSINTPETANYPYILVYWGCGGGGFFPLGGAGSSTDRMYLQFSTSMYYKIYMRRPTLTSVEIVFTKEYGSGYGICNTAGVRICAGSNVAFN